jgi:hypothetical protein
MKMRVAIIMNSSSENSLIKLRWCDGGVSNMVGIGYAAISGCMTWPYKGGPNWTQMNKRSLEEYFRCIDMGALLLKRSLSIRWRIFV